MCCFFQGGRVILNAWELPDTSLHFGKHYRSVRFSISLPSLQNPPLGDLPPVSRLRKESELVALMDKNGIGTDASIPTHVQHLGSRWQWWQDAMEFLRWLKVISNVHEEIIETKGWMLPAGGTLSPMSMLLEYVFVVWVFCQNASAKLTMVSKLQFWYPRFPHGFEATSTMYVLRDSLMWTKMYN